MALQKTFTNDRGETGNYWRIISYTDSRAEKASVNIACYKDKAFRDSLPEVNSFKIQKDVFIARKNFVIDKPEGVDYIAGAYTALKENAFFTGAVDC
jgi:hypothetical protein